MKAQPVQEKEPVPEPNGTGRDRGERDVPFQIDLCQCVELPEGGVDQQVSSGVGGDQ